MPRAAPSACRAGGAKLSPLPRPLLQAEQLPLPPQGAPEAPAVLLEDFVSKTDRPTYHPAWLEMAGTNWQVRPVPWFGSADLRGLTGANALAVFPPGEQQYRAGQSVPVLRCDSLE